MQQYIVWRSVKAVSALRKEYVPAYVRCLQAGKVGGDDVIAAMDAQLDEHVIQLFRWGVVCVCVFCVCVHFVHTCACRVCCVCFPHCCSMRPPAQQTQSPRARRPPARRMAYVKYMAIRKASGSDKDGDKQQQQHGGGWLGWLRGGGGGGAPKDAAAGGGEAGGAPGAGGKVLEADMGADEWQKLAELAMQSEVRRARRDHWSARRACEGRWAEGRWAD